MAEAILQIKSLLESLASAEDAGAERDRALAECAQVRGETAALQANVQALHALEAELEARVDELAQSIGPAERAAEEQALTLRAEVHERQGTIARQLQQIANHHAELRDLEAEIRHLKAVVMELGRMGGARPIGRDEREDMQANAALQASEIARLQTLLAAFEADKTPELDAAEVMTHE